MKRVDEPKSHRLLSGFLAASALLCSCADKVTPRGPADTAGRPGSTRNRDALRADVPRPPTGATEPTAREESRARPDATLRAPGALTSPDAGKGGFAPGGPASVLKEMYGIAKANDGRSIKQFFSKASAKLIEDLAKTMGGAEDGRDDPWRNIRNDVGQDALPTIIREEITANIARVWVRERNQPTESTLKFVREEDAWRLDFAEDLKAEVRDLPKRMERANDLLKQLPSDRDKAEEVLRRSERDMRDSTR
jgi:hypothetical protein